LVAYLLMKYVSRRLVGWVVTIFALSSLIFVHIERMVNNYGNWRLGINTSFMIECIHLSAVAWDYCDGGEKQENLTPERKKNALVELPPFLDFVASCLNPTQSFAGPDSDYADFRDFVYQKGIYANVPSTIIPCLKRFGTGRCFIVIYLSLLSLFPQSLLRGKHFLETNFFLRVFTQY
jgi:hypothetical protein